AVRPRDVLAPHPAVRTEDRAERAELKPARVELAGLRDRMEEPPDVRAPVRHAGKAGVQAERELRLERREVVVDVAGPARRAEALHPRRARATQQEDARVGTIGRFAVRERLM